jgi:hypothetical protein
MLPNQHRHWTRLAALHAVIAISLGASSLAMDASHFDLLAPVTNGQLVLLAVWLPFSSVKLVRRIAIYFVLGIAVSSIGLSIPRWAPHFSQLLIASAWGTTCTLLVVSLPVLMLRLLGWRLIDASSISIDGTPWQLSTATVFAFTLLVAMLLTLQQLVTSMGMHNSDGSIGFPNNAYSVLAGVAVLTVGGLGQCWAVISAVLSCLAVQGHRSRLVATLFIVALICALPMHVRGGQAHLIWVCMIAISMSTVILSLLYLRHCGMRIFRATKHTPQRATEQRDAVER